MGSSKAPRRPAPGKTSGLGARANSVTPDNHLGPLGSYLQDSLGQQEIIRLPGDSLGLLGNLPEFLSYSAPWARQAGAKDPSPPEACRFLNCILHK